jgi:hypothetical protein
MLPKHVVGSVIEEGVSVITTRRVRAIGTMLVLGACATMALGEQTNSKIHEDSTAMSPNSGAVADSLGLSTYAWDYAPWVGSFVRELQENWSAPFSYRMGLVSGDVPLLVVVEPSGEFSEIKIVGECAHASLKKAAVEALRSFSGRLPLPAEFAEERLVIELTLHYPQLKRRK